MDQGPALRRNLAVTETRGGAQHGALERVGQARMGARGHLVRVRVRVRVRMRMGKGLPGQGSRSTSPSAPTGIMLHTAFLSL